MQTLGDFCFAKVTATLCFTLPAPMLDMCVADFKTPRLLFKKVESDENGCFYKSLWTIFFEVKWNSLWLLDFLHRMSMLPLPLTLREALSREILEAKLKEIVSAAFEEEIRLRSSQAIPMPKFPLVLFISAPPNSTTNPSRSYNIQTDQTIFFKCHYQIESNVVSLSALNQSTMDKV